MRADLILLDDLEAREKAKILGLKVTGTVGILLRAKLDGKLKSLKEILKNLKETGFWISDDLIFRLLVEVDENP